MPPRSRAAKPVAPAQAIDEAAGRVRQVRVRCTAGHCTAQARGVVTVREVAPGILERPRYECANCGSRLKEERDGS